MVLIFVNLIPAMPNLTVIRTMRMLKPLRSISRLPTLKVIVATLVRSSQDILDVYFICFCVYLVFAILAMDLFGGSFAQVCLRMADAYCACGFNGLGTEPIAVPGHYNYTAPTGTSTSASTMTNTNGTMVGSSSSGGLASCVVTLVNGVLQDGSAAL